MHISGIGNGGDLETVAAEALYAYTASHTGALLGWRRSRPALGARLGPLDADPRARRRRARPPRAADRGPGPAGRADRRRPERLDGAGGRAEDPRGVLRRGRGTLLRAVLPRPERRARRAGHARRARRRRPDGRAHGGDRGAVEVTGAQVARFAERELGEALSVFPLTVVVQRIALELSEARGVSPDRFRYEEDPRREAAFEASGSERRGDLGRRAPDRARVARDRRGRSRGLRHWSVREQGLRVGAAAAQADLARSATRRRTGRSSVPASSTWGQGGAARRRLGRLLHDAALRRLSGGAGAARRDRPRRARRGDRRGVAVRRRSGSRRRTWPSGPRSRTATSAVACAAARRATPTAWGGVPSRGPGRRTRCARAGGRRRGPAGG